MVAAIVLLVLIVVGWLVIRAQDDAGGPSSAAGVTSSTTQRTTPQAAQSTAPATKTTTPTTTTTAAQTDAASGLPVAPLSSLPPEAAQTVALIADDGPFPYQKDGAVFGNFEGLLPDRPSGYYREYTVRTPGESDRGARRIVAGNDGELYYTADHYESFVVIEEEA